MKKTLLVSFFILLGITSYCQEYQSFLSKSEITLTTGDIPDNLILKSSQDSNGFTKISIDSGSKEEVYFTLKPFTYELFKAKFINIFPSLKTKVSLPGDYDNTDNNEKALVKLYSDISSYFFTVNERPQVATISLLEDVKVYANALFSKKKKDSKGNIEKDKNGNEKLEEAKFDIQVGTIEEPTVYITFYSGFIEKIEVHGKINSHNVKFVNKYSIGVSSLINIINFNNIRLFSQKRMDIILKNTGAASPSYPSSYTTSTDVNKNKYDITVKPEKKVKEIPDEYEINGYDTVNLFLYLGDLIDYQRIVDINANDISPDKQKVTLDGQQKEAKLYREESTKIIEAIVYTDIIGAANEENPNGVLQVEINKKFNIKTHRSDGVFSGGRGMFEYVDVGVALTKIEKDNKFLIPTEQSFGLLDTYRYRNFSAGGLFNLYAYENQNYKLNLFYDSGVSFSRSGFQLSEESEEEHVNAIEWSHQVKLHIFPEQRYGVIVRDRLFYYEVLDKESDFTSLLNKKKDWFNTIEFSAYYDVSTSAKIFLRYALVHELSEIDNNFSRIQFGTTFFLLHKNRKDK